VLPTVLPIFVRGGAEHACLGEFRFGLEADPGEVDVPLRRREVGVARSRL
jgi:hypothetical protein